MKTIILTVLFAAATLLIWPLYSMNATAETEQISVKVLEAHSGGAVNVEVSNLTPNPLRIWAQDNSWGWGNWSFEFFDQNQLVIFVRKPDQGFTVNISHCLTVPGTGVLSLSFDLNDGTWISHRIPIWPAYPSKDDRANAIKGCFAVLAIPNSTEANVRTVWTGTVTSPFH